VNLADNKLSGPLPSLLANKLTLEVLNLASNKISGEAAFLCHEIGLSLEGTWLTTEPSNGMWA
jgi:hypothetical protein